MTEITIPTSDSSPQPAALRLRWAMLAGLGAVAILVTYGLLRFPGTLTAGPGGYHGPVAISLILLVYGVIAWVGPGFTQRQDPYVLQAGVWGGLLVGLIFVSEIILEYILLPDDNTNMGLVEFLLVFAIFLGLSFWVAWQRNSFPKGVAAAIWSALLASLLWYITVLLMFYLFHGTPQQSKVFWGEGDYIDFAHSGMTDFDAFIMGDFLGAGFFHSLLVPLVAIILGSVGAGVGKLVARIRR